MKKWFSIRTLFLSSVVTKKGKNDNKYPNSSVLLEERVVLYHSKNVETAIKLAEKEARNYAKYEHINPFGEKVKCEYLNIYDTFELFDPPSDRIEVFSASDVYLIKKEAIQSAKNRLGPKYSEKKEQLLRKKFQHS